MKKMSLLLVLAMVISMLTFTASAEGTYTQSPWFDAAVEAGELPPVEERLPENPCLIKEVLDEYLDQEVGNYGGTFRFITNGVNWDADIFVACNEGLLLMESSASDVITPNVVESYSVNEDNTVYTFTLRKGLKWSDGTPVTMEDVKFGVNDYIFNAELTPVISSYMRDGGVAAGDPFTFTVIDDWTFSIAFKTPYGGFPVHISIAGWKGYTDFIKPAHVLKQFHINYAEECHGSLDAYYEFMQPFATKMGYDNVADEGVWCYIFNQVDCTNWELTDPNDAITSYYFGEEITTLGQFPQLYPWILTAVDGNNFMTFERNPYYFKVDADGQQMPYFDRLTSQYTEDVEMMQFAAASGEVDFMREAATINNISMYREYSADAGITAYTTDMHTTASILSVNFNYGLNTDGTVKDDDESKAWQEVVNDKRFLQALTISIDAAEIVDAVYNGFAEPCDYYACTHDIEGAKDLLDEMGCVDIDGDGFRETPSGLPLIVDLYITTGGSNTDTMASCELFVEYWQEIGLNAKVNPTDSTLLETNQEANELKIQAGWIHGAQLWHYQEWYLNMPLWEDWVNAGGLTGTMKSDDQFLEASQEWKDFINAINGCFTVDPVTAVNVNVPAVLQMSADNLWVIQPVQKIQQCVIINDDVANVPTGGIGISWDFAIPQMYYNNPEDHIN